MIFKELLMAAVRSAQTWLQVAGKHSYLEYGSNLHVGKDARLWAPHKLRIGNHVYIGKQVHIEANCDIGDYCLFANRVAIVGRHDHDFSAVGFPIRYAPWIGSYRFPSPHITEKAVIESDVWLGYGVIVLTGITVGRGCIVATGTILTKSLPLYLIVTDRPARVVGQRFADAATVDRHEAALHDGCFHLAERGHAHRIIKSAVSTTRSTEGMHK